MTDKPYREICKLCYEVNRIGFWVPNDVWQATMHPSQRETIVCLRCFTRLADEKGIEWDREIRFYPVSWVTHIRLNQIEITEDMVTASINAACSKHSMCGPEDVWNCRDCHRAQIGAALAQEVVTIEAAERGEQEGA